jgi:hypothetical protein
MLLSRNNRAGKSVLFGLAAGPAIGSRRWKSSSASVGNDASRVKPVGPG